MTKERLLKSNTDSLKMSIVRDMLDPHALDSFVALYLKAKEARTSMGKIPHPTDFELEAFKEYKKTPGHGALSQFKETLNICNISEAMRRLGRIYHYESKIKQ